ncbi:MAG: DNA-3-methyladenine glycosylase [Bacteroidales bacterium]|nr:DNA-3-methyladenine glycosylase [Bacteroidales bacterium]
MSAVEIKNNPKILSCDFFLDDVLNICPKLLGKYLVRKIDDKKIIKLIITEIEAYRGEEDLACHASKGRTSRTEVMYQEGGHLYVYLIYGMYYMLNIVTGKKDQPQAILIRGTKEVSGPGRLTKFLKIDKKFNGKKLGVETGLWIEDSNIQLQYITTPRIGIDYAKEWKYKPWRYVAI